MQRLKPIRWSAQIGLIALLLSILAMIMLRVNQSQKIAILSLLVLLFLLRRPRVVGLLLNLSGWAAQTLVRIRFNIAWAVSLAITAIAAYRALQPWGSTLDAQIAIYSLPLVLLTSAVLIARFKRRRLWAGLLACLPLALFLGCTLSRSPQIDAYNQGRAIFDSGRGDPVAATKLFEQSSAAYKSLKQRPALWKLLFGGESQVVECLNRYEAGLALVAQRKPDKAVLAYLEALSVLPPNAPQALSEAPELTLDVVRALEKLWLKGGGGGGRGQQPGALQQPQLRPQFGSPQPHDDL